MFNGSVACKLSSHLSALLKEIDYWITHLSEEFFVKLSTKKFFGFIASQFMSFNKNGEGILDEQGLIQLREKILYWKNTMGENFCAVMSYAFMKRIRQQDTNELAVRLLKEFGVDNFKLMWKDSFIKKWDNQVKFEPIYHEWKQAVDNDQYIFCKIMGRSTLTKCLFEEGFSLKAKRLLGKVGIEKFVEMVECRNGRTVKDFVNAVLV